MAKREVDYVCMEKVDKKEFGFVLMMGEEPKETTVEVVVIDHEKNWVRTIGEADSLDVAGDILSEALSHGFDIKGITFQPA